MRLEAETAEPHIIQQQHLADRARLYLLLACHGKRQRPCVQQLLKAARKEDRVAVEVQERTGAVGVAQELGHVEAVVVGRFHQLLL